MKIKIFLGFLSLLLFSQTQAQVSVSKPDGLDGLLASRAKKP
jgi:hypothetical protein